MSIDTSNFSFWKNASPTTSVTMPDAASIQEAMEKMWRALVAAPRPKLCYIRVSPGFWKLYRRIARPSRQQVGGSSLRAIKRRAVRRPW